MEGNRAMIDLRAQILAGEHPREAVFEYVKQSSIGIIFEIHTPRLPKPLINGLENMGLKVIVDELENDHFRIVTVKTSDISN
jgi:hypothetical protein